jgi:hypothetical protein
MSLFVLNPRIEVEIGNWAKHKKTLNDIPSSGSQKKSNMNSFIFFWCRYKKKLNYNIFFHDH